MNKVKIILANLSILIIALSILFFIRIKYNEILQKKINFAQDIHKGLLRLMLDLSQARVSTIQDVPADGQWHERIVFVQARQGPLEYLINNDRLLRINEKKAMLIADHISDLEIRRRKETPNLLEVKIKAQKDVSLTYNLKVRALNN